MGYKLGINGVVTFKNSHLKELLPTIKDSKMGIRDSSNINPFVLIEMILVGSYEDKNVKNVDNHAENVHKILEKSAFSEENIQKDMPIKDESDSSSNEDKAKEELSLIHI